MIPRSPGSLAWRVNGSPPGTPVGAADCAASEHSKVEWEGTAAAAQLKAAPRADKAAVAAVAARLPRAADLGDEHPGWEQLCAPKFK